MIGYLLRTEEEAVYTHACLEVYHYPLCPLMYVPWYLSQVRRQLHPPAVRLIWGWGRIEVLRVRGVPRYFEKRKFPSPGKGNVLRLRRLKKQLAAVCRKRKSSHLELESKTQFQVNTWAAASSAKLTVWETYTVPSLKCKYVGKKGFRERPFPEVFFWSNMRSLPRFCAFMNSTFLKWGLQEEGGTASRAGSIAVYKPALVAWTL